MALSTNMIIASLLGKLILSKSTEMHSNIVSQKKPTFQKDTNDVLHFSLYSIAMLQRYIVSINMSK